MASLMRNLPVLDRGVALPVLSLPTWQYAPKFSDFRLSITNDDDSGSDAGRADQGREGACMARRSPDDDDVE
eukprot:CAMPEP_0119549806 /NCGR_PEP_ID=MMETSP1352-20130426/3434_1 /TAXON_ID=265584 /ORGANISM="Stauroneis constricta, Strain CCMP1120" /LENGTH=71 /DNA_ID=CAMNT_0007595457 /DNA_START=1466 /DNA_END=1681 /DNA_ORIENTATION=+